MAHTKRYVIVGSDQVIAGTGNDVFVYNETSSQSAFLEGQAGTATSSKSAYLVGTHNYVVTEEYQVVDDSDVDVVDDSAVEVVVDWPTYKSRFPAYLEGETAGTPVSSSVSAYLEGGGDDAVDSTPAYLVGSIDVLDSQAAFLEGGTIVDSSTPAFLAGGLEVSTSTPAYLTGPILVEDSQSAFLYGQVLVRDSTPAYILGLAPTEGKGSTPAYLEGDGVWPFSDDYTGSDGNDWSDLKWQTGKTS